MHICITNNNNNNSTFWCNMGKRDGNNFVSLMSSSETPAWTDWLAGKRGIYGWIMLRNEFSNGSKEPWTMINYGSQSLVFCACIIIPCPQKGGKFYPILLHKFITHRTGKLYLLFPDGLYMSDWICPTCCTCYIEFELLFDIVHWFFCRYGIHIV